MSLTGTDIGHKLDRDPVDGRFRTKHRDLRLARLARIKQRFDQLLETYAVVGAGDLATLSLAAQCYADAEMARSRKSRVTCINAAIRLLKPLRRKPEPQPSIDELLGYSEPANG